MPFNKYELYEASVLDASEDVKLFQKFYRNQFKKDPLIYREDFCGTFAHSTEWVKLRDKNKAYALDLALEPIEYGFKNHFSKLTKDQQSRLWVLKRDVLTGIREKADLITAMNFSYFCLKQRESLKKYFQKVYYSLKPNGLFLIDVMGGSEMQMQSIEQRRIDWGKKKPKLIYFWEQKNFDPITHDANFSIHFKVGGTKKRIKDAFTYDWRLWTLPELREIMIEAGFKKADVYWEGSHRNNNGDGNGIFTKKEHEQGCEVWIAYIAAVKSEK
ncbi:MAG: hypothetical protein JWQ35_271 [Bacteriovoracaceae bacterium]|nr:hypothetical protein [Bacteriovoracaceae bacterium]